MKTTRETRPLLAILSNRRPLKNNLFHAVDQYYINAAQELAGADLCIVPCLGAHELTSLLARIDGVLLTGGLTNVHPKHYGGEEDESYHPLDTERDETSFQLVQYAKDRKLPLLAICLGLQEVNVALGGTLQNNIQDKPGNLYHRDNRDKDPAKRYGERHQVTPKKGGKLAAILGEEDFTVNSLHQQAIDRLADDLTPEAHAEDGIIEAVSLKNAPFFLGVQWHPEYKAKDNQQSHQLFTALGKAARNFALAR